MNPRHPYASEDDQINEQLFEAWWTKCLRDRDLRILGEMILIEAESRRPEPDSVGRGERIVRRVIDVVETIGVDDGYEASCFAQLTGKVFRRCSVRDAKRLADRVDSLGAIHYLAMLVFLDSVWYACGPRVWAACTHWSLGRERDEFARAAVPLMLTFLRRRNVEPKVRRRLVRCLQARSHRMPAPLKEEAAEVLHRYRRWA